NIISGMSPVAKTEKAIDKIGVITLDSEEAILEAEEKYNALSESEQKEVANTEKLTEARSNFDKLKKVYDAIENLGEITLENKGKVESARKLFNECDETLQEQITNKDTLVAAEKEITTLKAKEVEKSISEIGKVTFKSKAAIESAEKLYKALSDEGKKEVKNYDDLKKARTEFDKIAKTEGAKKAKEAFSILNSTEDKVQGITWYEPKERPYYADTRSYVLPYIGIQNNNAFLRLAYWYTDEDWVFWKSVTIMVDGKKYYDYFGAFNTVRDNEYGNVWEYGDKIATEENIEMLYAIADSKETIVRFQGDDYHYDLTISASDKKAIKNVLTAYEYADYFEK
ncbi:MAG: hypothetical protein UGF89_12495, partial [Acutalibacteraceae bacterium]|nr:hypothetical protein [Acutalibacteraceae bacterium]